MKNSTLKNLISNLIHTQRQSTQLRPQTIIKHNYRVLNKANYLKGANIAGFVRVADAMIEQGVV